MRTFAVANKRCPPGSLPRRMTVASPADSHWHNGRRAVRQILRGPRLQAKLTIDAPNDIYEQEADRVADEVMRMPDFQAQAAGGCRTAACSQVREEEGDKPIQTKAIKGSSDLALQRQPEVEEEDLPQTKQSAGYAPEVTPHLAAEIASMQGGGQTLPAADRTFFEPRFSQDFGKVRVHSDAQAAQVAREVHARAFTVGHDIVMGVGQFAPGTAAGQQLLAHELTHVVQQTHGLQRGIQRQDDEKQQPPPTRDEFMHEMLCGRGGAGLFGRTRVSDLFRFSGTFFTDPADVAGAEIEDLRTGKRDLYYVDSWLDDEWRIAKIELNQVIVVNATCGAEEVLARETTPAEPQPQKTIEVNDTNFGPGVLKIFDNCRTVIFEPSDKSKPTDNWTAVTKGENDDFFIRNGDTKNLYPPPQVEDYFHRHLLGEKCGEPKNVVQEPSPEDLIQPF